MSVDGHSLFDNCCSGTHLGMEDLQLLSLPDDVLLGVLAYLPVRQLFEVRVVCRRLRDLCLHRELWKCTEVIDLCVLRAAMRLAPCIGSIDTCYDISIEDVAFFLADSSCIVHSLCVYGGSAGFVTAVLLKLSALGGLKELYLHSFDDKSPKTLPALLNAVYNIDGLRELRISYCTKDMPAAWCDRIVSVSSPSLTLLHNEDLNSEYVDPFTELLLRTHATTLEEISLAQVKETPMSLLTKCTKLRYLDCSAHEDLPQLLELPDLETIELHSSSKAFPKGALNFLRKSSRLQSVSFHLYNASSAAPLLALIQSRSADLLHTLDVGSTESFIEALPHLLPLLPSLHTLSIYGELSDDLQQALTTWVPGLKKLVTMAEGCLHEWMHKPAVQNLLKSNHRLHITLKGYGVSLRHCLCTWCSQGCHKNLTFCDDMAFASHSPKTDCPPKCFRVDEPPCESCHKCIKRYFIVSDVEKAC